MLLIMNVEDLRHRIIEFRSLGMPRDTMIARLSIEGWDRADIAQILNGEQAAAATAADPAIEAVKYIPQEAPRQIIPETRIAPIAAPRRELSLVSMAVVLLAFGAFGSAAYMYLTPSSAYSISIQSAEAASSTPLSYGALPALSDPSYYAGVKADFISQRTSFIDADLSSMKLTVYIDGTSTLEVPIMAKGKVGSWWETPAGIYQIKSKETNHLSSIGDVYMPYSMDFQGNFFIHGWPYYPDGTPVATTYSGGCIRLSTDDAKRVFELVRTGMPVVVYNRETPPDTFNYQLKAPSISASEYLVADLTNGTVLASRNASSTAPIASITKLTTALVATEFVNLDKQITVPGSAIVYTTIARLKAGQSIRAYDLLFLLLQESSNEAAETLAAGVGRDAFIAHMNEKARAIGLKNTTYFDPSGAKDDISTPEDLYTLLRYIYDNRRFVFDITTGNLKDSAYGTPSFKGLSNFNQIKGASAALLGGKIGETNQAGETYAGIFTVHVGAVDRPIVVIALGSKDAAADVTKLLNFVRTSYAPAVNQ